MVAEEEGERWPSIFSASGFRGLRKRKNEGRKEMSNGYGEEDEEPAAALFVALFSVCWD